jgi:hypothetical protein
LPASIPAALAAIITRCLEHDPGARYQTAAELAAALAPLSAEPARASAAVDRCAEMAARARTST